MARKSKREDPKKRLDMMGERALQPKEKVESEMLARAREERRRQMGRTHVCVLRAPDQSTDAEIVQCP